MEYSDQKAKEIIDKFKLDAKIKDLWKHRNSIPDHYNNELFVPYHVQRSQVEEHQLHEVIEVLKNKKLHHQNISEHLELQSYFRLKDAVRGKARLTPGEVTKIRMFFKKQRVWLSGLLQKINEKDIMSDKQGLILCELYQNPFYHSTFVVRETGVKGNDAYGMIKRLVKGISNGGTYLDGDRRLRWKQAFEILMLEITLT